MHLLFGPYSDETPAINDESALVLSIWKGLKEESILSPPGALPPPLYKVIQSQGERFLEGPVQGLRQGETARSGKSIPVA